MAERLIESLHGTGAIHAAGQLLRMVKYDLSVWSVDPSVGDTTQGGSRIDGHIDITGAGEAVVLAGADSLILTLEDGRRLAFQLTSSDGGIGRGRWVPLAGR
jgi:hypothetical protein